MASPSIEMDYHGVTDKGKVRKVNEDHFLIASLRKVMEIERTSLPPQEQERFQSAAMARLMLVADGLGGETAGERASGLALKSIASYVTNTMKCFYQLDSPLESDLLAALESSVRQSHAMVKAESEKLEDGKRMATTLTVAHILWPRVYLIQVGDSRCYLLSGEKLRQLTTDQTLAQRLVDEGTLPADKAAQSKWSNVLYSTVGSEMTPVTATVELQKGDVMLLCTDGLTKHVPDDGIAAILIAAPNAEGACRELVSAALEAGGSDNVTVVVNRFV